MSGSRAFVASATFTPSAPYQPPATAGIYLADRGVTHTNSAAVNTGIIQEAVTEAETTGRPVMFPWTPPGQYIDLNDRILVATGGVTLLGYGPSTRMRQTVFPRPIFEVLGDNTVVEGFSCTATAWNATGFATTFRGGETYQGYSCGVWVGANNVTVRNITADNLISAVRTSNFDVDLDADSTALTGCVVENVQCSNVAFGFLGRGLNGFVFRNIRGQYNLMPGSGLPPHLIYFTGSGPAEAPIYSTNVVGSDCWSDAGAYSFAYQVKYVQGGTFTNLRARNSFGLLHVMNSADLQFVNCASLGDISTDLNAGSIDLELENTRIDISNTVVTMAANGKLVRFGTETTDSRLRDCLLTSSHSTAGVAGNEYDVDIRGTNNTVERCDVRNLGAVAWTTGQGIWSGAGSRIVAPRGSGNRTGVTVRTGATGAKVVDYDESDITISANGLRKIDLGAVGTVGAPRYPISVAVEASRYVAYDLADRGGGTPAAGLSVITTTTSGHTWSVLVGTWRTDGTRIVNTVTSNSLMVADVALADIELGAGIKYTNREFLVVRVVGNTTYIAFRLNHTNNLAELYTAVSGAATFVATAAFTPQIGRRYRHMVRIYGALLECFIDGVKILTHTLSAGDQTTFGAQTRHGLGGNGQAAGFFDNITWRSLA